ncbi:hypothetical protein F4826_000496 [Rahnella inusitata]|nr:hypothetical protein [Rahnella inusitata]
MKLHLIALTAVLALAGCTNTHHAFMDHAYKATLEGHRIVVFKHHTDAWGREFYRPQFQTDCRSEFAYEDRPATGGCYIEASRLTDIQPFNSGSTHTSTSPTPSNPWRYVEVQSSTIQL